MRFAMPRRTCREIKQICGPIPTSLADLALPIQKTGIYGSSMGSCIMFIYIYNIYMCVCIRTVASGRVEFRCLGWDIRG